MTTPARFTPGTILIPISEQEAVEITLQDQWHNDIIEYAGGYHAALERLRIAKSVLTNPDHESGNTALIRFEISDNLAHLATTIADALTELTESEKM